MKLNENRLTIADLQAWAFSQLERTGVKVTKSRQRDLFIEALARNLVMNELVDMMRYIEEEQ